MKSLQRKSDIRKRVTDTTRERPPLLSKKTLRRITRKIEDFFTSHRQQITYLHWVMFFVFVSLILIPTFLPYPPEEATFFNNFTVFARFIFWGIWFPLVLLSLVFFGRAWCGLLCPQGAMSEYVSRIGLDREPPSWIRWEGTPILSFIFVTILGQLVGVREYPLPMLEIFGGTMLIAFIVGFLYTSRHRTWCRYLCPIGLLLGIFSRLGMVSFEGSLYRKKRDITGSKTLCPTFIDLSSKATSRHCIECFRCANWRTSKALSLRFRPPGKEIVNIAKSEPSIYEVLFLFAAIGIALGAFYWQSSDLYTEYKFALGNFFINHGLGNIIGRSGPWWIMSNYPELGEVFLWLDVISISTFMLWTMFFFALILSALTYTSVSLMDKRVKRHTPRIELFSRLGYIYTPIALLSLFLGLGVSLFQLLKGFGLGDSLINSLRAGIFITGLMWNLYIGYLLIKKQGTKRPIIPYLPQIIGLFIVAGAWYPLLFPS